MLALVEAAPEVAALALPLGSSLAGMVVGMVAAAGASFLLFQACSGVSSPKPLE
jgi:hypothetical protein